MVKRFACLILAAGESKRFEDCKLAADLKGKPVLAGILNTVSNLDSCDGFICLGAHFDALKPLVSSEVKCIINQNWIQGMGSSIACGVTNILADTRLDYEGIIIVLGDQYRIDSNDLNTLIKAFNDEKIICSNYQGIKGVPTLFPKRFFSKLQQLDGTYGARKLIKSLTSECIFIDIPNAQFDIDTTDDLEKAQLY